MAEKARFYELRFKDGHGVHTSLFPAQNKDDLLNNLKIPSTVKLVDTSHVGWLDVSVEPNAEFQEIEFQVKGNSAQVTISEGDLGYDHLKQLFAKDYRALSEEIDKYHDPDS